MSDATIQARVQTLIVAMDSFSSSTVTLGNYRVMDSGSPPYAVIIPGPFTSIRDMPDKNTRITWTIYIDVIAEFLDDSYSPIVSARQEVKDGLDAYPALNSLSGVIHALITGGDDLVYIYPEGGSDVPHFVRARLRLEVNEFAAAGT